MALDPVTAGIDLIGKAIDRFVPDPTQAAAAKLAMYKAEREGTKNLESHSTKT